MNSRSTCEYTALACEASFGNCMQGKHDVLDGRNTKLWVTGKF